MSMQSIIETKLREAFTPTHLEVINESFMHNVPEGSESHFKVIVVSDNFAGQMLLQRHRETNKILKNELEACIHALSIHALTVSEWEKKNQTVSDSPACRGGSKT